MISRIANAVGSLEGISMLLTVILGVGCLAYVAVSWEIYFIRSGQYLVGTAIAIAAVALSVAAAIRIPIALVFFFGAAAAIGTAFLVGVGDILLP